MEQVEWVHWFTDGMNDKLNINSTHQSPYCGEKSKRSNGQVDWGLTTLTYTAEIGVDFRYRYAVGNWNRSNGRDDSLAKSQWVSNVQYKDMLLFVSFLKTKIVKQVEWEKIFFCKWAYTVFNSQMIVHIIRLWNGMGVEWAIGATDPIDFIMVDCFNITIDQCTQSNSVHHYSRSLTKIHSHATLNASSWLT